MDVPNMRPACCAGLVAWLLFDSRILVVLAMLQENRDDLGQGR